MPDICVAPIAPWFIPYHAVVMLPAYILLLTVAIAEEWPKWLRATSAGACVASLVVRFAIPSWNYRGAMFLISFVILLSALGTIRRALALRQTNT